MTLQQIKVPNIGDYINVDVIEINVQVGDYIKKEDSLITLETNKASLEIPAPTAGKIVSIHVSLGDKVSQNDVILSLNTIETLNISEKKNNEKLEYLENLKPVMMEDITSGSEKSTSDVPLEDEIINDGKVQASPMVRRLARILNIDLRKIIPSGRRGRITKDDCYAYLKPIITKIQSDQKSSVKRNLDLSTNLEANSAEFGNIELQPLSNINKISANNLSRNWITIPHVTFYDNADITELDNFLKIKKIDAKKADIKLTPLSFLIKAAAKVLKAFPRINSSLSDDGKKLIIKNYYHIGFATNTDKGLMVPVIKNVDQKGIYKIASEIMSLAQKAKAGKLKLNEMRGATFTISSLGILGTTAFTPIINMPEVAIIGVSKAEIKPVWDGDKFSPKYLLPLSFSADHRVIDGAMATRFLTKYITTLSDIREILL